MADLIKEQFQAFNSAADMEYAARDYIAQTLHNSIAERGRANVLLSGGSSPRTIYQNLSTLDLAWDKVTCGLVDERWVAIDEAGSNAAFIHETLLQNKATAAKFIPMTTAHKTAQEGAKTISDLYAKNFMPLDLCIMGMGLDGHTASWFPTSPDLRSALDIYNPNFTLALDAKGCPVAGEYTERISLSLPAILSARHIILLIAGDKKRAVLEKSIDQSVYDAPVKALLSAGPRLSIFWGA